MQETLKQDKSVKSIDKFNVTANSIEFKEKVPKETSSPKFGVDPKVQGLYVEGKGEFFRVDPRAKDEVSHEREDFLNIEDYDFLDGAKAYRICDIKDDDDDQFNNTTFPYDRIEKCLQIFEKRDDENPDERPLDDLFQCGRQETAKLTYLDIKHYWDQVYFLMSVDLGDVCECGNLELCQNYIDMVLKVIYLNDLNNEEILNQSMFNIFRMVTRTVIEPIFEDDDYLSDFFELVRILPEKYPHFPKFQKSLRNATDTMMVNMKKVYNYLHDFTIVNMINGYLTTCFEIYAKLAETDLNDWDKVLKQLNYDEMSVVANLDFFFEKSKVQVLCMKNEDFIKNFEKLYSSIYTLQVKSEFLKEHTSMTYRMLLDCFAIIFMFGKSKNFLGLCTNIWALVDNKLSMQNNILRFCDFVAKLEFKMINNQLHMSMLLMIFKFIRKFFGNPRLYYDKNIHTMGKYCLKKIFMNVHNLQQNNFQIEEQQPYAVEISINWIGVMKEFQAVIVMNFGDFDQAQKFKIYEPYLQQILHDLQKWKVYSNAQKQVLSLTDLVIDMGEILKVVE